MKIEMKQEGVEMRADQEQFAVALHTWRLRAGLTQQAVAQRWGCSRYTIMRAERGRDVSWMQTYRLFANLSRELAQEEPLPVG